MTCDPTKTPSPDSIDIPALKAKYIRERQRRMHPEGQKQYIRPTGKLADNHVADPHMPVAARKPISEQLDVAILGAGWGGIMAAYHLMQAGVTDIRNIDHAGDFGGVWYWNRYPGIQCDNDAYCYLPLLEETGFTPAVSGSVRCWTSWATSAWRSSARARAPSRRFLTSRSTPSSCTSFSARLRAWTSDRTQRPIRNG
jgi:hypothetical protein